MAHIAPPGGHPDHAARLTPPAHLSRLRPLAGNHIAGTRFLLALLLALLLACFTVPGAFAQVVIQQGGQGQLKTKYFTIFYPQGEEATAQWFAGFVDDMDSSVSDLLGSPPVQGITLHIYATEAEYMAVNPLAETHPGVLAHSIPERKEIGVAVERLRQQPQDLARETFRHEMTHVVAGDLSGQNLPIAFQEGLAQYNELSSQRAEDVVKALTFYQSRARRFIDWTNENDRYYFTQRIDLAYPESYTIMAFLADRYGMGAFSRFLKSLKNGNQWPDALAEAYGKPEQDLESEWRDWLPGFFDSGYKQNVLTFYDLGPGVALYEAAQYTEAQDYFNRSVALYNDLGKRDRAALATAYELRAAQAQNATNLSTQAASDLDSHNYAAAQIHATQASHTFGVLKLGSQQQYADGILGRAKQGVDATETLRRAGSGLHITDLPQAEASARSAGETFAALGDQQGVDEANSVLAQIWNLQRGAGVLALVAGAFIVTIGVLFSLRARASRPPRAHYTVEENPSWL